MVLDIGLPGMDGFEVLDQLRSQGSRMPVIILTARDSVTDTVAALDSGADDYMAKPFRFAELMARIRLRLRSLAPPDAAPSGDDLVVGGAPAGPAYPSRLRPAGRARALRPRVRPGRDLPAQPRARC